VPSTTCSSASGSVAGIKKGEPSNKELKLTKPGTIGASQLNSSVGQTTEDSRLGRSCRTKSNEIADLNRRLTGLLTAEAQDRRQIGRAAVATERGSAEGYGGWAARGRPERASEPAFAHRTSRERAKCRYPATPPPAPVQREKRSDSTATKAREA
jgi:hypothetical protein